MINNNNMVECYDCGSTECRCIFILEIQQFIVGSGFIHSGYMNRLFNSRKAAADYYNLHNPHMRDLNAHGNWCSDWDVNDKLRAVVRLYHGELLTISPYRPYIEHDTNIISKSCPRMVLVYIDLWFTYFIKPWFNFLLY